MKTLLPKFLLLGAIGALAATPGCNEEEPTTGDEQDTTASIEDTFAKNGLAGGCTVTLASGKTKKTKGTGGVCPTTVNGVLDVIKANPKFKMHTFVVSEQGDVMPGASTPYRFVVAVDLGDGKSEKLFLSALGSGAGVSDDFLEVLGFNENKGVYVYYDLSETGFNQIGDGSGVKSDALSQHDKPAFRCEGCHKTGMPLMKELHDSWMNWNSTWFSMGEPGSKDALFRRLFDAKERADNLELLVISGTKTATKTRVKKAIKEKKLNGLLTQLMCDVGEPSLIAAHSKNSKRVGTVETFSSMVPTAILLNQLFTPPKTGGTGTELGLEGHLAMSIPSLGNVKIDSASYVKALGTMGQTVAGQKGDAMFPMSSPEKSYADDAIILELMSQNLLDKNIVADVLMTDFTVSSFSKTRCDLASTIPANWATVEELRTQWSTALGASSIRGAKGLKARLDNTSDFDGHAAKLETFVKSCVDRSSAAKDAWALDLLKIVSQRRKEFIEVYEPVVESEWLIPGDTLQSKAHAIRLSGDKCLIQNQTEKFVGEDG